MKLPCWLVGHKNVLISKHDMGEDCIGLLHKCEKCGEVSGFVLARRGLGYGEHVEIIKQYKKMKLEA